MGITEMKAPSLASSVDEESVRSSNWLIIETVFSHKNFHCQDHRPMQVELEHDC